MKKKELVQQIGRLPEDTEIRLANGEDLDVVKVSRNGIVTNVILEKALEIKSPCACANEEAEEVKDEDQGN